MAFRDRFFTPTTAKAILSWRLLVGAGVAVALGVAGVNWALAIVLGVAVYAGTVLAAMPRSSGRPAIDPFTLSEPWRQLVQGAQGSCRKLRDTISGVTDGPLRRRLEDIAGQVEHGLDEAWTIARRGDDIDAAVRRLDPTGLRSKLTSLEQRAERQPSAELDAALESVREQLRAADRMREHSEQTAASLRLAQTQLDALVARASEVSIGTVDAAKYAKDVDDLVLQLEALRQAAEETRTA